MHKYDLFHVKKWGIHKKPDKAPDKVSILTTVERMEKSSILNQQRNYIQGIVQEIKFDSVI